LDARGAFIDAPLRMRLAVRERGLQSRSCTRPQPRWGCWTSGAVDPGLDRREQKGGPTLGWRSESLWDSATGLPGRASGLPALLMQPAHFSTIGTRRRLDLHVPL